MTEQQLQFRRALDECGIRKGISRDELIHKMVTCIPDFFAKRATCEEKTVGQERATRSE